MTEASFIEKVKESLFESNPSVGVYTKLTEIDGWDSLGRLSIVALLQEKFGKVVDTKTLISCINIGDIVNLVKEHLEK